MIWRLLIFAAIILLWALLLWALAAEVDDDD